MECVLLAVLFAYIEVIHSLRGLRYYCNVYFSITEVDWLLVDMLACHCTCKLTHILVFRPLCFVVRTRLTNLMRTKLTHSALAPV